MALSMKESSTVASLATLLYDFLPASGNNATAFPLAARKVGVGSLWPEGYSKGPGISQLLTATLEQQRSRFCPLILEIVKQSMVWRSKREPLSRAEIDDLNRLLPGVGFKIPELLDPDFLASLPGSPVSPTPAPVAAEAAPADPAELRLLTQRLQDLASLKPQERGFAFEPFLHDLFKAYGLAPRASFRPRTGEQIDGSFELGNDTYLLEAKWHSAPTPAADLHILNGKLNSRPTWSRALFISYGGFSTDGLEAFNRGKGSLICMDGYDLYETLNRGLPLDRVIAKKARYAVETGLIHVSVRDLFP
jgi:hypothetical protein